MPDLHLDPACVKSEYTYGEILPSGETQTLEFKSADAFDEGGAQSRFYVRKRSRYIGAFLNSVGGALLIGVEDGGSVSGCVLSDAERTEVVKIMDTTVECIDPQVEIDAVEPPRFIPVVGGPVDGLCVLIIVVRAARRQPVYYTLRIPPRRGYDATSPSSEWTMN